MQIKWKKHSTFSKLERNVQTRSALNPHRHLHFVVRNPFEIHLSTSFSSRTPFFANFLHFCRHFTTFYKMPIWTITIFSRGNQTVYLFENMSLNLMDWNKKCTSISLERSWKMIWCFLQRPNEQRVEVY